MSSVRPEKNEQALALSSVLREETGRRTDQWLMEQWVRREPALTANTGQGAGDGHPGVHVPVDLH
jgi:hypothetical protein